MIDAALWYLTIGACTAFYMITHLRAEYVGGEIVLARLCVIPWALLLWPVELFGAAARGLQPSWFDGQKQRRAIHKNGGFPEPSQTARASHMQVEAPCTGSAGRGQTKTP